MMIADMIQNNLEKTPSSNKERLRAGVTDGPERMKWQRSCRWRGWLGH
jgi:hypothetical protein